MPSRATQIPNKNGKSFIIGSCIEVSLPLQIPICTFYSPLSCNQANCEAKFVMPPFPVSRILVLGASGQFGRRLCRRLVQLGGLHLLLGGRDERRLKVAQRQLCAVKPDAAVANWWRFCSASCPNQSRTQSMTGSPRIDTSGLASARRALPRAKAVSPISYRFGATENKGQAYCNDCSDRKW